MRFLLCPLLLVAAACTTTSSHVRAEVVLEELHFIEDDYPRAVALAREQALPIFVEIWAPW